MSNLDPAQDNSSGRKEFVSIEGWIDLGNLDEAVAELNKLDPQLQSSIDFLKAWIRIHAAKGNWSDVKQVCASLTKQAPDDPFTIQYDAEVQHQEGNSELAIVVLKRAEQSIQKRDRGAFYYAMGRYSCAIDSLTLATAVLGMAIDINPMLRTKALKDRDLEKIWLDIQEG